MILVMERDQEAFDQGAGAAERETETKAGLVCRRTLERRKGSSSGCRNVPACLPACVARTLFLSRRLVSSRLVVVVISVEPSPGTIDRLGCSIVVRDETLDSIVSSPVPF